MGTMSHYTLEIMNEVNLELELLDSIEEAFEEAEYQWEGFLSEIYNNEADDVKWYSHVKDMKEFSMMFPNVVFILMRDCEAIEYSAKYYFKNGLVQVEYPMFAEYDESKLK